MNELNHDTTKVILMIDNIFNNYIKLASEMTERLENGRAIDWQSYEFYDDTIDWDQVNEDDLYEYYDNRFAEDK